MRNSLLISGILILAVLAASCSNTSPKKDEKVRTGIEIGQRAPELVEASVHGENIALSSLRGKMVLVNFWASWNIDCRAENPGIVANYMKFRQSSFQNAEGFTIYSVSLDRREYDWIDIIEKDSLIWKTHVSDLKGWKSAPAAQYGVMTIPANYLIDGEGIILGINLNSQELEARLREYLK